MDDSLKDLEKELKGLRLRQPSAALVARMERELAEEMPETVSPPVPPRARYTSGTNFGSWKWSGWRMAGMAAAVALVATVGVVSFKQGVSFGSEGGGHELAANETPVPSELSTEVAAAEPDASRYQPVAATNVLYDVKDEGYVVGRDDTAARRVRARYVDTYTWKNPKNNASLKWSVPRDEVRVIPASWN